MKSEKKKMAMDLFYHKTCQVSIAIEVILDSNYSLKLSRIDI